MSVPEEEGSMEESDKVENTRVVTWALEREKKAVEATQREK